MRGKIFVYFRACNQSVMNKAKVFATSRAQVIILSDCLEALSCCILDGLQKSAGKEVSSF